MAHSYLVIHPSMLIARHNGNPLAKKMITELADGLLATDKGEGVFTEINFRTGEVRGRPGVSSAWPIFQAAYDYTKDNKYLMPISDRIRTNPRFDPTALSKRYAREIVEMGVREYINTHGSLWIDRISTLHHRVAQEDRLGGVALTRIQDMYPQHHVSWKFNKPATYQSLAIYLPEPDPRKLAIVVYNLEKEAVKAEMTVWQAEPGKWRIRQGLDRNGDQVIDGAATEWVADLTRAEKIDLVFPPRELSIVTMELIEPATIGYRDRADLGIGKDDVRIQGNNVTVRVYNIGAVESSQTILELRDANGQVVAVRDVPPVEAPLDLIPRWQEVKITVPEGTDLSRGSIIVDPKNKIPQITRKNTILEW
jgi:hypothetical protein